MNHARRKPVSARGAAEGAVVVIACCAGAGALLACALVYGARSAARSAWTWVKRRLRGAVMRQAAQDAGLVPALAARSEPWEPAPEPDTPPPWWTHTDTPSPAELTIYDHGIPVRRS